MVKKGLQKDVSAGRGFWGRRHRVGGTVPCGRRDGSPMTRGVTMEPPPGFLESTGREFPADFASIDPADLATYGRDWTEAFPPRASILCRPRTTDEVSRLMKLCAEHRLPVVPSGGRTGLACGALAT